jgi:phosphoribosylformylglycinamidine synthase PurS subunit
LKRLATSGIGAGTCFQRKARPMKVRVFVSLKNGVLDPQGRAIHHAIEGLGIHGVHEVRAGKMIELEVDDSVSDGDLEIMCKQLLANMVIEDYRVERVAAKEPV